MIKPKIVQVRFSPMDIVNLEKVCAHTGRTQSQVVRDCVAFVANTVPDEDYESLKVMGEAAKENLVTASTIGGGNNG
jgi:hypothetical protein